MERRAELAAALAQVERRITAACERNGRSRSEVTLIAVTKNFPATDAALLAELGVHDLAESRDQEGRDKAASLASLQEVRWHFVGQLQRNKCRSVVRYADAVHSVDRLALVEVLARAAAERTSPLAVFIQVNVDAVDGRARETVASRIGSPTAGRGGVSSTAVAPLVAAITAVPSLLLKGVMAVAPQLDAAEAAFARLARVSDEVQKLDPSAVAISAGMSGDFETAIKYGATHLRVGRALLGIRTQ